MTRFDKKIDSLFWFIIAILPIITYFLFNLNPNANSIDFINFLDSFSFGFVEDILNNIFIDSYSLPGILTKCLSWFVSVEIIHVFVDFIVFIPRFAHRVLGRFYNND